ncbi:UNKNOWN [Stylonychia lemnae]|uniref:Uncharacterized protein n=1 Tax=Stylonychia lemnae TaxID=5949 RepID=A0A078AQ87_STYLE|nr:UNKNOWN [Stylonychia lemnae]|eukprot:CDW83108.1 UNKNOWN [Stylonychia lemnae]
MKFICKLSQHKNKFFQTNIYRNGFAHTLSKKIYKYNCDIATHFFLKFTTNITIRGVLCYAESVDQFQENCIGNDIHRDIVLLNPFDETKTNDLLSYIQDYNVYALIIGSTTQVDSGGYYYKPAIISLVHPNMMEELRTYSISYGQDLIAEVKHQYLTNCQALNNVQMYFFGLCTLYGLIILMWNMSILFIYNDQQNTLQKALLIIPIFKLLRLSIYTFYIGECPWTDQLTGRYLMMALVTVSTIYQTVFMAILLLISKGWLLTRQSLSRSQATLTTVLMGFVYLSYSAYYVSQNVAEIKNLVTIIINILYFCLYVYIVRNTLIVLVNLRSHLNVLRTNNIGNLQETLILKISIMRYFAFIATAYFSFEIVAHGILPYYLLSDGFDSLTTILYQIIDLIILSCLLWTLRPRQWPEYFNLGILEDFGFSYQHNDNQQSIQLAPMREALIDRDLQSLNTSDPNHSFRSDQQILIYNPLFVDSFEDNDKIINLESNCGYQVLQDEEEVKQSQRTALSQKILRSLKLGTKEKGKSFNKKLKAS